MSLPCIFNRMLLKTSPVFLAITIVHVMSQDDLRVITTLKYSSRARTQLTVVSGMTAFAGDVPFMVSIKRRLIITSQNETLWTNLCGGSIISETKILTAAHCFEYNDFYYKRYPDALRVVAGELHNDAVQPQRAAHDPHHTQWTNITKVWIHRHFHFPDNDISLAKVDPPWAFEWGVAPITPATRDIDYYNMLRANNCFVSGYGKVSHEKVDDSSQVLLMAPIKVYTRSQCALIWEINMDGFICTDTVTSDVSQGDSGGPLACRAGEGYLLAGVVCGKNYDLTSLFTRVSAYRDWIDGRGARVGRSGDDDDDEDDDGAGATPANIFIIILCNIYIYVMGIF